MKKAIRLALKGNPSPNPKVGAIIVQDGKIVGKGYHKRAGENHAEIEAILDAKGKTLGGHMIVTLEPCNHWGRTSPCTKAIIEAGIKKVTIGTKDPNPHVKGGGIQYLARAGLEIQEGILEKECLRLNEAFFKYVTKKLPFVTLKAGMSLDGRLATKKGDSKWITSQRAQKTAHLLRRLHDAILVGINTILVDNPFLTVRLVKSEVSPWRVVLDSQLKISDNANIIKDKKAKTLIVHTKYAPSSHQKRLQKKGIKLLLCKDKEHKVDIKDLLEKLGQMGITSVLVEGGGEVHASFIKERAVDKIVVFISPKIIGGKKAIPFIGGEGITSLKEAFELERLKARSIGKELIIEAYPLQQNEEKELQRNT
jgi:diaminohydroxyphosphoribosylaminopyrimidine deaminase/5-amino-6-(5-phosphoribosylamino)uracil reductase